MQCTLGIYPFMFASVKDFEPVVERLIQVRSTEHTVEAVYYNLQSRQLLTRH